MSEFSQEEIKRTVNTLIEQLYITCRDDLAAKVDDGNNLEAIDGVGEKRKEIVAWLWTLSEGDWYAHTGLPYHSYDAVLPHPETHGDLGSGKLSTFDPDVV